ncbi:putative reverse transcriptase domain, ribonuclease H-like domain protein [Tanacetum coccineum]|uniref:Reverse transcriptase domain, ribonuclease H-like domain protein n=1 Tax=Tanacetum coccineum TaxID=301880 RepID=A0ABQ5DSG8_9ASTR
MLLGRTAMQRMGIVVSTIHGANKFHTEKGIGTILSINKANKGTKRARKILATSKERVLSYVNAEEQIIINDKYPDQTVTIEKQLPDHFKKELQNLLKSNADVFAWTHADMTGILRTIMVEGKPFNTEHKLNEYSHIKPIKQNKSGLGPDRNMAACVERSLDFFKVLKGCKDKKSIQWTTEADKALEKMKKLVQALPTLIALRVGETLTMHLAASKESISDVLAAKRNKRWTPIYFVSRVLQGAELNYPALEKLVLALVHAVRRLRRYFQAHTITVLTNTSIKQILTGPEKTGRVAKWAIELGEHDIVFLRREEKETPADFLAEIPSEDNEKKEKPKEVPDSSNKWILYTDGASNLDGSGVGLMLIDPEGKEYTYALRFEFETTNNETEYEALLAVEHVHRNQNKKADALSKLASMTFEHLTKEVLVEVLTKRSIEEKEVSKVDTQERKSWMDPIHEYLLSGLFPEDTREARNIRIQAPQYKLIRGNMEVAKVIQDCKKWKEESAIRKTRTSGAISAGSTWRFSHWGIHIIGPLPTAPEEAVIPIIETINDRGRVQKATKGKEIKEVTLIEQAYYQNKLRKYHNARSSHPAYIVGDFILLKQNANEWQGPYIINEVHKEELYTIEDAVDQSLVQIAKGTSLRKFYM